MAKFIHTVGVTFHTTRSQSASLVSKWLCDIVAFLHRHRFLGSLERFDDWLEHDGLHFKRGQIDVHQLFDIIGSVRSLLEACPEDEEVCIGVAPEGGEWYLRIRVEWDEEGNSVVGRFDITLPDGLAESLRHDLIAIPDCELTEELSADYFARITV